MSTCIGCHSRRVVSASIVDDDDTANIGQIIQYKWQRLLFIERRNDDNHVGKRG